MYSNIICHKMNKHISQAYLHKMQLHDLWKQRSFNSWIIWTLYNLTPFQFTRYLYVTFFMYVRRSLMCDHSLVGRMSPYCDRTVTVLRTNTPFECVRWTSPLITSHSSAYVEKFCPCAKIFDVLHANNSVCQRAATCRKNELRTYTNAC